MKVKNEAGEVFEVTEHAGGEVETKAGTVDVAPGMLLLTNADGVISTLHPSALPNFQKVD